jgi:hypothetical protein
LLAFCLLLDLQKLLAICLVLDLQKLLAICLVLDLQKFPHDKEIYSQNGPKLVRQNKIECDFSSSKFNLKNLIIIQLSKDAPVVVSENKHETGTSLRTGILESLLSFVNYPNCLNIVLNVHHFLYNTS